VNPLSPAIRPTLAVLALASLLAGCSSGMFSSERVDYRSNATKINPLEVPPDLTQISRDTRYQQQRGVVSASALPAGTPSTVRTAAPATVAPTTLGDFRIEKDANQRWISVPKPVEQVWPVIGSFWQDLGFTLVKNDATAGVMETNWAENRANLPVGALRSGLTSWLGSVYSTGEADQYRTRVERTATGTEIFITHRGMIEVYTTPQKDFTKWEPRPSDPTLENEMLSRLLVRLGAAEAAARSAVDNPVSVATAPQAPRARLVPDKPASLELDDSLDRAWRRVGVALDRSGFTVEDRDRAAGLYFVRYVDPRTAGQEVSQGFFAKLFGTGNTDSSAAALKYQVALKSDGSRTLVSVLNSQGAPDTGENSRRIATTLANELK